MQSGSGVKRDEIHAYALISAAMEIGLPRVERDAALYQLGALSQRFECKAGRAVRRRTPGP